MRHWAIAATTLLAASIAGVPATAEETDRLAVSGSIDTSFDRITAEGISVTINGELAAVDADGSYSAQLELAPYYQLRFEGSSIHTAIQTFGLAELYDATCECLKVPSIGVVARKEGRIELFFAGDAMAGRRYVEPIWGERQLVDPANPLADIKRLLEPMRPYIETADLASVNLEIALSDRDFGNSPPKSVTFYAPPALAQALAEAGFDHVSLGNNHSYDFLEEGLVATIDAVEAAGLAWSGAGRNEQQALLASRLDVDGQPLSLLGYVGWKGRVEPNQVAEAEKGGAAYGSDANIAASVEREASSGRSVIAQYHGSREYSDGPTEESERRMKLAVDRGAALVASHHPHVAHGFELYNDALIAYSTGNFLFDQYFLETHGSFVFRAWLEGGKVIRAEAIPIRVLDYRPVPAVGSMREAVLDRVGQLSAKRNTLIARNGGHGVIVPGDQTQRGALAKVQGCGAGTDLFRAGDFENARYGEAKDRSLKARGAEIAYPLLRRAGHVMELTPGANAERVSIMPSTFFRVVGGGRFTVCGMAYVPRGAQLSLAYQMRGEEAGRFDALDNAPLLETGSTQALSGGRWQPFSLEFSIPEEDRGRPIRPFLHIDAEGGVMPQQIALDDLRIMMRD